MKKIIHFFLSSIVFLMMPFSASSENIDETFLDIDETYQYYDELDFLYNKGIIIPDDDEKLNPDRKLLRGEFMAHAFKLGCESCKQYDITPRIVADYSDNESFFDVSKNDEYFYCSEEADVKNYLVRNDPSEVCSNGVTETGESPFCTQNTVSRQEAIRAILMISGIYSQEDYNRDLALLESGEIETSIGDDVQAEDGEGRLNPYFLYLRKAVSYSLEDRDLDGKIRIYDFLNLEGNKLNPTKEITREEFLYRAYIASKATGCEESSGDFAALIDVYPAACEKGEECGKDALEVDAGSYDLKANYAGVCESGLDEEKNITWRIYHIDSNSLTTAYGPYVDNAIFDKEGKWEVYMGIYDSCGNSSTAKTTIYVGAGDNSLSIEANPLNSILGNEINFRALSTNLADQDFQWDFGDFEGGVGEEVSHEYLEEGSYFVTLRSETAESYIHVNVYETVLDIATFIDVYSSDCSERDLFEGEPCTKADLTQPVNSYDLYANIAGVCDEKIDNEVGIVWKLENTITGKTETITGLYIDNYNFLEDGLRKISLNITDNCGEKGYAESYLQIGDVGDGTSLGIEADNTNIIVGETINFRGLSSDPDAEDFVWNFGDGGTGNGENTSHVFNGIGTYVVELQSCPSTSTGSDTLNSTEGVTFINTNGQIYTPSDGACYTHESTIVQAQAEFETVCEGLSTNVDCDEMIGGKWVCSSETIGLYSPTDNSGVNNNNEVGLSINDGVLSLDESLSYLCSAYVTVNVYDEGTDNDDRDGDGIPDDEDSCIDISGVAENSGCPILPGDRDGDGVYDEDDNCPSVAGVNSNAGCPNDDDDVFSLCGGGNGDCAPGFICSIYSGGPGEGLCLLDNVCALAVDGGAYGNVSCNTCPCDYSVDFNSELKICDIVFPAITSPDGTRIYSRGEVHQITE